MTNAYLSQSNYKKILIIVTIMLVAILEVLDSTIVNVALPNMMPSLSANQNQITWVLTSYVVAAAMMLPLTGFLSDFFGTKNLLLIDIVGFMMSSFLCGTADQLNAMVFYRLLQGGFGAALIPLSQSILRESFPLEEQGKAMSIWGLGIMAAPVFGPTLGGYILAHASWRWIFYLNAPICFLGLIMTIIVIPESKKIARKIDYLGVLLMFLGIGCLQIFLDQGNSNNWFQSNFILLLSVISAFSIIVFLIRSAQHPSPVITLSIFKDRNFTLCTVLLALFCGCLFGFVTLEPIMLENLFHYTPMLAGKTMISIGISSAIAMCMASPLMSRVPIKFILIASLLFSAAGIYYFSDLNLEASQWNFIVGDSFFGFGMGLFMVPLTTYSLATISADKITEAAGLFSYGRMLGTSVGVSLLSTLVARETQANWLQLGEHINPFNNNLRLWLSHQQLTIHNPQALAELKMQLAMHASMIAFIDAYQLIFILMILFIPLVMLLKHVKLNTNIITH
ncbi:MAG: MFS transporter [Gammaproteobacteria bacterium RIFCSPLOWO2_02_FULL_42_14]|nr:MAG: MFS transporter [Gammaproteobacteria bacterium RIFCSPHIGHO2_02_FULL_42_43]OGT28595.1 MAG: MFS transporter [Gammaproteobacteria bacterium RIFCSPHIGHO2_01_FULL_42_8]OGT50797.1 MAG: MFS transporter [Gammaproteobacteria bacterium RIFCSPHIGHO2_12_FULL_41_25]OGT61781.1 MAG: MFS transporter [Gammaproteobacteria bacterium RIFCSPLOWO2_02_FULL_42_14]OGT85526.1 MAG: MFS transporter [Gammaproteobacteria bacterium RIFCSPLOWO2_12_FULL_42_18]